MAWWNPRLSSCFYLPAVLAGPIAADTGWPLAWVVGGLSIGLLVAANASPRVGIAIHRHGGRPVLASAALLVIGLETGCGLYDPTFGTLRRLHGAEARPAITT